MKNKIFRILILIVSIFPALLCLGMVFGGMQALSFAVIPFIAAMIIYFDYVYNTIKLFTKE